MRIICMAMARDRAVIVEGIVCSLIDVEKVKQQNQSV